MLYVPQTTKEKNGIVQVIGALPAFLHDIVFTLTVYIPYTQIYANRIDMCDVRVLIFASI